MLVFPPRLVANRTFYQAHLAHTKVDLKALDTVWPPPFAQRALDPQHCNNLVTTFAASKISRATRDWCLIISLYPRDFESHLQYTIAQATVTGMCEDSPQAREKFRAQIIHPELSAEFGIVTSSTELSFLLFDPDVKKPVLEAGAHRRHASSLRASQQLDPTSLERMNDWDLDFDPQSADLRALVTEVSRFCQTNKLLVFSHRSSTDAV